MGVHFLFVDNDLTVEIACDYIETRIAPSVTAIRSPPHQARPGRFMIYLVANREEPWDGIYVCTYISYIHNVCMIYMYICIIHTLCM